MQLPLFFLPVSLSHCVTVTASAPSINCDTQFHFFEFVGCALLSTLAVEYVPMEVSLRVCTCTLILYYCLVLFQ